MEETKQSIQLNQSQSAGFKFENEVKEKVFGLNPETNNTDIHDVDHTKNIFDTNENVSIKSTGSNTICCSDIMRFFSYDFDKKNTILVIQYEQVDDKKIIKNSYEINYCKELHQKLFGEIPEQFLLDYVNLVKKIKPGRQNNWWSDIAKKMKKVFGCVITVNPKVDSKKQRRVQCSIPNFTKTCEGFIKKNDIPNVIRGKIIYDSIDSSVRKFNK